MTVVHVAQKLATVWGALPRPAPAITPWFFDAVRFVGLLMVFPESSEVS
jgi:hypothetical protein